MKKIKDLSLGFKFSIVFILILLLALGASGLMSYRQSSQELMNEAEMRITAIRDLKRHQIEDYFGDFIRNMEIIAGLSLAEDSILLFADAFKEGLGSLDYQKVEEQYGNDFKDYSREMGFYDLFLIDLEGNIVFSVEKEADLGTNLEEGRYRDTTLAEAYRKGREEAYLTDFAVYEVNGNPTSHLAAPIENDDTGELLGVIAVETEIDEINAIMQESTGMGDTGESYLVGTDYLMRSDSRFDIEGLSSTVLELEVRMDSVERALAGESGVDLATDYRGEEVISAYTPVDIMSQEWAVLTKIDHAEIMSAVDRLRNRNIVIVILALIISSVVSLALINNVIVNPLNSLTDLSQRIANNDLKVTVDSELINKKDEIGVLANSFNQMINNLKEIIESLLESVEDISSYSEELSASAEEGNATVETTNALIDDMSAGIQQISASAEEVASFSEEANSQADVGDQNIKDTVNSIKEINEVVEETVKVINNLDNTSQEIGQIVEMITNIAEQTNLLALNAAIEAARAGEYGKGFAVVAEEIRQLASETAEATDKIANLVNKTQSQSREGINKVKDVDMKAKKGRKVAKETGELFDEIKNSVEETSSQIEQTASATNNLAQNSDQITNATDNIRSMSDEISNSSQELAQMAQRLQGLIEQFKI
ncbi:methyl-accepting chemotaxis protein [Natroniella sp. ANB-PHB2]|uniref:methyl-accepting chemotaxis protein n=1 Tax=Natroniella sp. ANB-PHB2 TaxID=3384444 RepID=UPI0038D4C090